MSMRGGMGGEDQVCMSWAIWEMPVSPDRGMSTKSFPASLPVLFKTKMY